MRPMLLNKDVTLLEYMHTPRHGAPVRNFHSMRKNAPVCDT